MTSSLFHSFNSNPITEMIKNIVIGVLGVSMALFAYLGVLTPETPKVGALASPNIPSPYLTWGGVAHWAGSSTSLIQATTTVCAIQSPAATSTLNAAYAAFSISSTTASTVTIAKASTAFATTTVLEREPVAANAQADIMVAANYSNLATSTLIFAPNTWVVVGMEGGTGTFSPTGNCGAEWRQIRY